jgi:murein DD-endopeptidase MepM/ murein hydrolase activator NlpD
VAVAVGVVCVGAGSAVAVSTIDGAGTVDTPAERIVVSGNGLLFPMDPSPKCIVFNNFGGSSKTYGAGGHQGVDIGADFRQEVYAVADGVLVERLENASNAGNAWRLLAHTGDQYRYYHLDGFADGLEAGDNVVAGQLIGYVGDTGNATPGGWHLHFEVRPGPQPRFGSADPVDPVPLLDIPTVCTVYP